MKIPIWLQSANGQLQIINASHITQDPEGNLHFTYVTKADESGDNFYICSATSFFRREYELGRKVNLEIITNSETDVQSNHFPERQFVTEANYSAFKGRETKLWCLYGGNPKPNIRYPWNWQP